MPNPAFKSLAAEDFKPGYRYWDVRPGFEDAWTIASVEIIDAEYQVWRNNECVTPQLVVITRRDGDVRVFEMSEEVAIQGPWHTDADTADPTDAFLDNLRTTVTELRDNLAPLFGSDDNGDIVRREQARGGWAMAENILGLLDRAPGDAPDRDPLAERPVYTWTVDGIRTRGTLDAYALHRQQSHRSGRHISGWVHDGVREIPVTATRFAADDDWITYRLTADGDTAEFVVHRLG